MVAGIKVAPATDGMERIAAYIDNSCSGIGEQYAIEAIAVYLGVREKAVRSQLSYARKRLAGRVGRTSTLLDTDF